MQPVEISDSKNVFEKVRERFSRITRGKIERTRASKDDDKKKGKMRVIDEVEKLLQVLATEQWDGRTEEEAGIEFKRRGDEVLKQLYSEYLKEADAFSEEYRGAMLYTLNFFLGRFFDIAEMTA